MSFLESVVVLEGRILGAIFLDQTIVKDVAATLPVDIFRQTKNRELYKMILELDSEGLDINPLTIVARFPKRMELIGGSGYILEIATSMHTAHQVHDHMHFLLEHDARIKAIKLLNDFKQRFEDPDEGAFEEVLNDFEQKTLAIRPKIVREDQQIQNITEWYENLVMKAHDPTRAFGLMTGWEELDRMTLGLQRTDMIIVGARTSIGKSAFANELGLRVSSNGINKVAMFSLEMNTEQIYNRMIANLAQISLQAIRVGGVHQGQINKIAEQMDSIRKIYLDDTRNITADYICSEMRRLKRQGGLDLVIVDYLQEIKEPSEKNDNSGSGLHRVAQKLRAAAKECDCTVVALSQIKQEVDARANKRPFTSDLSGSSGLANVADGVILLYRDEYYNPDTSEKGIMEVNLAKQRNGPTGIIKMNYNKDYQQITSKGDRYAVKQMALL